MTKKAIVESILKEFRQLLRQVEASRIDEVYPVMYGALEENGLIERIIPHKGPFFDEKRYTFAEESAKNKVLQGFDN